MPVLPATIQDVNQLVALVNSAYRGESSKRGWTTEADMIDGQRIDTESMTEQINDPEAVILKYVNNDGFLSGCVYLKNKGSELYVGMLTVSPQMQAGGIGRQLLQAAEDYARSISINTVTMTVITRRAELLQWYYRRGYSPTGEVLPLLIDKRFGVLKQPLDMYKLQKELA
ncbi:GNAT family N-acetyltransferase [Mucilaginibacter litoreus]|uniref:GNAT family N-acetyltransferase n=1 Tax=Mucilaginibacter litoreus TaxID=1048221 RepID=A0ABW3APK9_9SPHI